jgi:16S rRNA processing protein RimM
MRSSDRKILLGKLGKPHGVKGFLFIHYYGKDANNLTDYAGLVLDNETSVQVEKLLIQKDRVILKFYEINTRNDAEKLRDKQLYILEDSLPVLDSNQVYYFELEGLMLMMS